jgi:hypothetical protein
MSNYMASQQLVVIATSSQGSSTIDVRDALIQRRNMALLSHANSASKNVLLIGKMRKRR